MSSIRKNIVFIDNMSENWETDSIEDMSIYSDLMDYIPVLNKDTREDKYTKDLAKKGNLYAQTLLKTGDSNTINCGITRRIANALKKWSALSTDHPKYALFDWDGTISCAEGFSIKSIQEGTRILPTHSLLNPPITSLSLRNCRNSRGILSTFGRPCIVSRKRGGGRRKTTRRYRNSIRPLVMPSKEFLDDMFMYMINPTRINMLRDLFRTLLLNGVHIHILTHNMYASIQNPYRIIFIEMLWRLFNENLHQEHKEQYKDKTGAFVQVYSSSSSTLSVLSKEDINAMLHSTVDYTNLGEMPLKKNIFRNIVSEMY